MLRKRYRLRYLPLFYEELDEKMTYIAENPQDLIMEVRRFLYNGQNQKEML